MSKRQTQKQHHMMQCCFILKHHGVAVSRSERSDKGARRKGKTDRANIEHAIPVEIHEQTETAVCTLNRLHGADLSNLCCVAGD